MKRAFIEIDKQEVIEFIKKTAGELYFVDLVKDGKKVRVNSVEIDGFSANDADGLSSTVEIKISLVVNH